MKDILFLVITGLSIYIFSRLMLKEPILPWGEKRTKKVGHQTNNNNNNKKTKRGKVVDPLEEEEAAPFRELFSDVDKIENHMIQHFDNTFTMIAEVEPVNYFLLDEDEQEGIDSIFETWLSQLSYSVRIYLQNRFVDLTLPIEEIQKVMQLEDDLHPLAFEYGQNMIRNMKEWQSSQPRFETKRYLIFYYKVDLRDIKAENDEEFEAKIVDKAFTELRRRLNTAEGQLRKAEMNVQMLTTSGISEVLYYGFNRRKAIKNHYRDIEEKEQLALYVTADQRPSRIVRVKGEIEDAQKDIQEEESNKERQAE